jgi:lipopolysaccharide transport system ATP-binding protein
MKPILEIQNVSKKFMINHEQQPYLNIRDTISNIFKSKNSTEDFWALNDVSFNVMPGDTVGIIGKNGAGKSTLLKILSKITPPTSGKIIGRGRIASLLEVGTGFHAELSGRENIFMNGSILGMRKNEIVKNFDAIVDFSGVEKFLDTPLKHYSSGMQLRLAFAVAAFLENEILIIDEVLAVGDAEFQKKCIGKMEDVSKSGRTILFVSHNMGAIANLCKTGVLLINGKLKLIDKIENVVNEYSAVSNNQNKNFFLPKKRSGNGNLLVQDLKLNKAKLLAGEKMVVEFHLSSKVKVESMFLDFRIDNYLGEKCLWISNKLISNNESSKQTSVVSFEIPKLNLNTGIYKITYCLFKNNQVEDTSEDCISFEVLENNFYENWNFPSREQTNILTEFNIYYK